MKSNVVRTILDWVLIASLVLSVIFLYQFFSRTRELRNLQASVALESQTRQSRLAMLNVLVAEANRYAEQDPGMRQLLESIRAATAASATNPASQPVAR